MIIPNNFAFHVTYTCPLSCAHCCFSSGPNVKDKLDIGTIIRTIATLPESIKMVAFTGGEPFLLGRNLDVLVREARKRNFVVRIVTSAYHGKDKEKTIRRLEQLRNSGLNEISISWDDYHAAFVDFNCIKNVFWACKELQLTVAINIVQDKSSKWNREKVARELGINPDSEEIIVETSLNLTGRAEKELNHKQFVEKRYIGPCPYIISGPTLSAKNKLLACCGVIPETGDLVVDSNYQPENLNRNLEAMRHSLLFNWIFLRGPYDIVEFISKEFNITIPTRNSIGGNCEACSVLFTNKAVRNRIEEAIALKKQGIIDELHLLNSLGILNARDIHKLWREKSEFLPV